MKVVQFKDEDLAHFSYIVWSMDTSEMAVIDPSRDTRPYIRFAAKHNARIVAIIGTHPHADFVSGLTELQRHTGANIYVSGLQEVLFKHKAFDEGANILLGHVELVAIQTPGHSPDSISIAANYKNEMKALFSGDTLLVGDCGRPDLRKDTGLSKEEMARQLYDTLQHKLIWLEDDATLFPAHGEGSLCGGSPGEGSYSSMLKEKYSNWSMQPMPYSDFEQKIFEGQSFVPGYFPYNVQLNKEDIPDLQTAIERVPTISGDGHLEKVTIVDGRASSIYKKGFLPGAVNIPSAKLFCTWLGTIVKPGDPFYLFAENQQVLEWLLYRSAKIGYEPFIIGAGIVNSGSEKMKSFDKDTFQANVDKYTILDVRNPSEFAKRKIFKSAISIPLFQLLDRLDEVPANKPVVVHCTGGYRSAIGSSIVQKYLGKTADVFDMGEDISSFL